MLSGAIFASLYGFTQSVFLYFKLKGKVPTERKSCVLKSSLSKDLDVYWKTNWSGRIKS